MKITELVKSGPAKNLQPQSVDLPTPPPSPSPDRQVADQKSGMFPVLVVSSHRSNCHKVQYKRLSCTNTTSQLSTTRISSPYLTAKTTNTSMSEIVSVFKDIAQLNPLFCYQITNFSINQAAANVFDESDTLVDFAAACRIHR